MVSHLWTVSYTHLNEKPEVPETPKTLDTPQSHEETKVSNAPKTGDSTNIWMPILLLAISTGDVYKRQIQDYAVFPSDDNLLDSFPYLPEAIQNDRLSQLLLPNLRCV